MQAVETADNSREMSYRIVDALATVEDTDALSMQPPIYDTIDLEAVEGLLDTDVPVEIQFEYNGHTVVAKSDGTVSIDGAVVRPARGELSDTQVTEQRAYLDD